MKTIKLMAVALLLLPLTAVAAGKVAVVNPMVALSSADYVKQRQENLQKELKDDEARARKLAGDLQELQKTMQRDGMTMSDKDKQRMQDRFAAKNMEFQSLQQTVQQRLREDQEDMMSVVQPKLQQALDKLAKQKNIDVVINAEAVFYSNPDLDITDDLVKALNKMNIR